MSPSLLTVPHLYLDYLQSCHQADCGHGHATYPRGGPLTTGRAPPAAAAAAVGRLLSTHGDAPESTKLRRGAS